MMEQKIETARTGLAFSVSVQRAHGMWAVLLLSLAVATAADGGPLPRNWPLPPSELERRFTQEDFTVLQRKGDAGGGGKTGALRLAIAYQDGTALDVKWKTVPHGKGDGWNNSPRKELAAYEIQRWIFDENDFIVPTVALHCATMDKARSIQADAKATFPESPCMLGTISVWLRDVSPKGFYDEKRFQTDALYARYVADLNLLTYLIGHRDTREGNVLLSTDASDPRAYLVDNGIAFDTLPWNLRVTNWFRLRVPWLRRETVDRLRKVNDSQLQALANVAELEADSAGVFRVVPPGADLDPEKDDEVRRVGKRIQFGLDDDEIDDVKERIDKLLKHVDSGKQPVR